MAGGKRHHSKMTRLHRVGDVFAAHVAPPRQVLGRDEDAAVGSGSAARSTGQAIELFGHRSEYGARSTVCTWWTSRLKRDLVRAMRKAWVLVVISMLACQQRDKSKEVALPRVAPETVVVSWSFISRSQDRRSTHVVLNARRELITTTRSASGTIMSVERTVSKDEYANLVDRLRKLNCCSLKSTTKERSDPAEAKPLLELQLGDVRCEIELWDHEWREGLARECGFAVAQVHRAGFVPDPPVDDPPR